MRVLDMAVAKYFEAAGSSSSASPASHVSTSSSDDTADSDRFASSYAESDLSDPPAHLRKGEQARLCRRANSFSEKHDQRNAGIKLDTFGEFVSKLNDLHQNACVDIRRSLDSSRVRVRVAMPGARIEHVHVALVVHKERVNSVPENFIAIAASLEDELRGHDDDDEEPLELHTLSEIPAVSFRKIKLPLLKASTISVAARRGIIHIDAECHSLCRPNPNTQPNTPPNTHPNTPPNSPPNTRSDSAPCDHEDFAGTRFIRLVATTQDP